MTWPSVEARSSQKTILFSDNIVVDPIYVPIAKS